MIVGRENLRVIRVESKGGLVLLLAAEAVKTLDRGVAVRAVLPTAGCPPFEVGGFGRIRQRLTSGEQCGDVDAIVGLNLRGHLLSPHLALSTNKTCPLLGSGAS
jgi:hypothetical protein